MHGLSRVAVCIDSFGFIDYVSIASSKLNIVSDRAASLFVDSVKEELVGTCRSSG